MYSMSERDSKSLEGISYYTYLEMRRHDLLKIKRWNQNLYQIIWGVMGWQNRSWAIENYLQEDWTYKLEYSFEFFLSIQTIKCTIIGGREKKRPVLNNKQKMFRELFCERRSPKHKVQSALKMRPVSP